MPNSSLVCPALTRAFHPASAPVKVSPDWFQSTFQAFWTWEPAGMSNWTVQPSRPSAPAVTETAALWPVPHSLVTRYSMVSQAAASAGFAATTAIDPATSAPQTAATAPIRLRRVRTRGSSTGPLLSSRARPDRAGPTAPENDFTYLCT